MGRRLTRAGWGAAARVAAMAIGCSILAHCSSGSKYSDRMVADDEPIPKGGGSYKVGKPYNVNGRTYFPRENSSYRGEGIASWYGPDFHGKQTSNGDFYDMHAISAAHPTMPLPSYARVTNLDNGRSIIVRINDRGPYVRNRIIDLSIGTAKALNFYGHGLARVRVEYVGPAPLEGSDDKILLATLRDGSPAPAPSKVMLASAKPFLPAAGNKEIALVPGRRAQEPTRGELTLSTRSPAVRSASADPRIELPGSGYSAPATARTDGPLLGLMSGRGLY
jgi:rare lipoprotein A